MKLSQFLYFTVDLGLIALTSKHKNQKQITIKIGIPGSADSTQLNAIKTAKANQGYTLTFSPYGL